MHLALVLLPPPATAAPPHSPPHHSMGAAPAAGSGSPVCLPAHPLNAAQPAAHPGLGQEGWQMGAKAAALQVQSVSIGLGLPRACAAMCTWGYLKPPTHWPNFQSTISASAAHAHIHTKTH